MLHALAQPWAAWEVANAPDSNPGCYQPWLGSTWGPLFDQWRDAYAFGFRVFFVHRPYGEPDNTDVMDMDARVENLALPLARSFPDELGKFLRDHHDAHAVVYLGSLTDADMRGRLARGDHTQWIDRANRSVGPVMNMERVHLGFDHAVTYPAGSAEWFWCELLRAMLNAKGRECVIESLPREDQRGYVGFTTEGAWHEHPDKRRIPDRGGVRWFNGKALHMRLHDADPRRWLKDCKATGAIPCIDWRFIERFGLTWEEVSR